MTRIARVTSKGQITIPRSVRRRLGVEKGDAVAFAESPSGDIVIRRVSLGPLWELQAETAEQAQAHTEDDVLAWVRELREELFRERFGTMPGSPR